MKKTEELFSEDQRFVHHLILSVSSLKDLGLLKGKMGAVLFLFHYARYTLNEVYEDIAGDLLDEIWEEINENTPADFESGMSGIGWGIEYLIQNKFVEADGLEICEEIDDKIMTYDMRRIKGLSLEKGLLGLLHYVLIHIKNNIHSRVPFDKIYLQDLYATLSRLNKNNIDDELRFLLDQFVGFYTRQIVPDMEMEFNAFVNNVSVKFLKNQLINNFPLGLKGGFTDRLLLKIIENK